MKQWVTRWLGWIAIGWLLLVCALGLVAYGRPSNNPSLHQRTMSIAADLKCLVCQGESVADSPSGFAQGIRGEIAARLRQRQSADQIKSFLVSRYGDRILLAPPDNGIGRIAWLGPPVLVGAGIVLLVLLVIDWRRRGQTPIPASRDDYLERVRAELAAGK
jgi:cytochrome c-type biogenesis protein CcmH